MAKHQDLIGDQLHVPGYVQDADPGAVGPGKLWVDSSGGVGTYLLKIRNADDTGWEIASSAASDEIDAATLDGLDSAAFAAAVHQHVQTDITDLDAAPADAQYMMVSALPEMPNAYTIYPASPLGWDVSQVAEKLLGISLNLPGLSAMTTPASNDRLLVLNTDGMYQSVAYGVLRDQILALCPNAFLSLSDVPDDYEGQAGKVLAVNPGETALEFITPATGGGDSLPVGAGFMWFAAALPSSKYLWCAGQVLATAEYPDLFAAIGYQFGGSGGAFNLPDLRGRSPLGLDNMGGTPANRVTAAAADVIGGSGGEENHPLSVAEMPSHQHMEFRGTGSGSYLFQSGSNVFGSYAVGRSTEFTGGSGVHNNMSPYLALPFIIKALP
ncbi:phage tail protein [Aggregatilinea lenta]|uniref:phage tail protein n=1 Tax=Aggregatilinea lenta TaxID=913108 RepID=UPI000E5A64BF|nr:tail fiber protein [Aggregatilinea lenta]